MLCDDVPAVVVKLFVVWKFGVEALWFTEKMDFGWAVVLVAKELLGLN